MVMKIFFKTFCTFGFYIWVYKPLGKGRRTYELKLNTEKTSFVAYLCSLQRKGKKEELKNRRKRVQNNSDVQKKAKQMSKISKHSNLNKDKNKLV
jgi:hypothetical protein